MSPVASLTDRALAALGYQRDLVIRDFPVWRGTYDIASVDVAAFAAPPADMTTATIIVSETKTWDPAVWAQLHRNAVALAAPIVMQIDSLAVRIFGVEREDGRLSFLSEIPEDSLFDLEQLRDQLGPDALVSAKWGQRQLTLFPIDVSLLSAAKATVQNELTIRIQNVLRTVASVVGESDSDVRRTALRSSRLVVGALTCALVRDKQGLDLPLGALVDAAQQRYPRYFDWLNSEPSEHELLAETVREISDGISYRGFAPSTVSEVYERVLVTESERRALGIHYTPPELAALLLQSLPVEELPPDERKILDPTCGSGTLLIAGYDRLRSLQPHSWTLAERHNDLTSRLHGRDRDAFAVQITKMALLLHDLTGGNGWNVANDDALRSDLGAVDASIVVANPPWMFAPEVAEGRRGEQANRFVNAILNRLPNRGLMGLVLPSSWLTSFYSRKVRDRLMQECDVFEVWRLPETVFRSARAAPTVICARRRSDVGGHWRVFRRITSRPADLEQFYKTGIATEEYICPDDAPLVAGGLTSALAGRRDLRSLSDYVDVRVNPQPKPSLTAGHPSQPGTHVWLPNARVLHAFGEPPASALVSVRYPDDFHRNSPVAAVASPKVLVGSRWADNPWRLKVGIDLTGVIVRNSLFGVTPKENLGLASPDGLFAVMALLGSGVASLWVDEQATKRSANKGDLLSLPVPQGLNWRLLARIGQELYQAHTDPARLQMATRRLESVVWSAYGLPEDLVGYLTERLAAAPTPEGSIRYAPSRTTLGRQVSDSHLGNGERRIGAVLKVAQDSIHVWINTVTPSDGAAVPLPVRFPGALLYEGATFETDAVTLDRLPNARFWFQTEAWLDDDGLDAFLAG
jgi:hypothetical protein